MINAAIVGLGWWGKNIADAVQGNSSKLRFVHGVTQELDATREYAQAKGFKLSATLDEALAIKNADISEELALPPVKIHCSILAEDAIKAAVADFRSRHPVGGGTLVSEQPACASSTR